MDYKTAEGVVFHEKMETDNPWADPTRFPLPPPEYAVGADALQNTKWVHKEVNNGPNKGREIASWEIPSDGGPDQEATKMPWKTHPWFLDFYLMRRQ